MSNICLLGKNYFRVNCKSDNIVIIPHYTYNNIALNNAIITSIALV